MDVPTTLRQNAVMIACLAGCAKELATLLELSYTVPEMKAVAPEAVGFVIQARELLQSSGEKVPEEIQHLIERLNLE